MLLGCRVRHVGKGEELLLWDCMACQEEQRASLGRLLHGNCPGINCVGRSEYKNPWENGFRSETRC